jgi:Putative MetA-pathway of phenol degradation
MARICLFLMAVLAAGALGCASIPLDSAVREGGLTQDAEKRSEKERIDSSDANLKGNSEKTAKPAKTLMEWAIPTKGRQEEKEKSSKEGNDIGDEEEKRLDPDRPHLPEAASTVGLGRVVLESGYTFTSKGPAFLYQHSYPEALLRVGMFADWFEFRISQNFINQKTIPGSGQPASINGAQDLSIGFKLGLTEQKDCLPEAALIIQTTVPSGSSNVSNDTVMPGVNLDLGWEIVKDRFGMETVTSANGARDDVGHAFVNFAQGITAAFNLTRKLEAFTEYDLFVPLGAIAPEQAHLQEYVVGGLVYFLTNDLEVDIRAGVGLNNHASDYLLGTGFAARY